MLTLRLLFLIGLLACAPLAAHPGGTDVAGCHTCRTNCHRYGLPNGEYHCHESKPTPTQPPSDNTLKADDAGKKNTEAPGAKRLSWLSEIETLEYQEALNLKGLWDDNSLHPLLAPPESKANSSGRLFLWISVADAVVYIDDKLLGIAKDIHQHTSGISIPPGSRSLIIFRPGFEIFRETLHVSPHQITSLKVELLRAADLGQHR